MTRRRDAELGLGRKIARRDFLNGCAVGAAGILGASRLWAGLSFEGMLEPEQSPDYYPPALTGLRGSHPGSFEAAHALRDGTFWDTAAPVAESEEAYDLVIVGGGLSGLAAAYFFRQQVGPSARVLILDNHDDFGGHAKRNEFTAGQRTLIGYGGTYAIESPAPYSAVAKDLIAGLGIDVSRYSKLVDRSVYSSRGLRPGVFFDRETFGADRLLPDPIGDPEGVGPAPAQGTWSRFLAEAPLPEAARTGVRDLVASRIDYMKGLSSAEKKARKSGMPYLSMAMRSMPMPKAKP
jgi:spermidine dehydrogenase